MTASATITPTFAPVTRRISGRALVATSGAPVAGVRIRGMATHPEGQPDPPWAEAVTNDVGAYTLTFPAWPQAALPESSSILYLTFELPPGFVLDSVTKDVGELPGVGPGAMLLLEDLGSEPIDITLATGPTIAGTVTNGLTEAPMAGVRVSALRPNSLLIDGSEGDAFEIEAAATTDATGSYTLNVRAGEYVILAAQPESAYQAFWTAAPTTFQASLLSVEESADGVDIALVPVTAITGELRSGTTPVFGGVPSVRVVAYAAGGTPCCQIVGEAITDENSTFLMYVPQGTYRIAFKTAPYTHFATEWWKDATAFANATDVVLGSASVQLEVDLARVNP